MTGSTDPNRENARPEPTLTPEELDEFDRLEQDALSAEERGLLIARLYSDREKRRIVAEMFECEALERPELDDAANADALTSRAAIGKAPRRRVSPLRIVAATSTAAAIAIGLYVAHDTAHKRTNDAVMEVALTSPSGTGGYDDSLGSRDSAYDEMHVARKEKRDRHSIKDEGAGIFSDVDELQSQEEPDASENAGSFLSAEKSYESKLDDVAPTESLLETAAAPSIPTAAIPPSAPEEATESMNAMKMTPSGGMGASDAMDSDARMGGGMGGGMGGRGLRPEVMDDRIRSLLAQRQASATKGIRSSEAEEAESVASMEAFSDSLSMPDSRESRAQTQDQANRAERRDPLDRFALSSFFEAGDARGNSVGRRGDPETCYMDLESRYTQIFLLISTGRFDEAQKDFDALDDSLRDGAAYETIREVLAYCREDYDAARDAFETAYREDPDAYAFTYNLVMTLRILGEDEEAERIKQRTPNFEKLREKYESESARRDVERRIEEYR